MMENKRTVEVKRIIFTEGFWYDDELFIEAGEYDFTEETKYAYPMILVNDEWLDLCDIDALDYYVKEEK